MIIERPRNYKGPQPPKTVTSTPAPAWPAAGAGPRSSGAEDPITPPGGSVGPNGATDIGNPNHEGGNIPTLSINDPLTVTTSPGGSYNFGRTMKPGSRAEQLGVTPDVLRNRSLNSGIRDIRSRFGFNAVKSVIGGFKGSNPAVQQEIDKVTSGADAQYDDNTSRTAQYQTHDNAGNPVTGKTFTEGVDDPTPQEQAQDRLQVGLKATQ